ncbi:MAG: DUF4838 domain-containing protein [Bacteroidaceae bacterium]|nr:DUF4838 domain-containing protein [Bacteroidaceae bacterium]
MKGIPPSSTPTSSDGPTTGRDRYLVLDALRGFALLGIVLANFPEFGLWTFLTTEEQSQLPTAEVDGVLYFLLYMFVDGKFYTIFSLLFGIGFSLFLARHSRGRFLRRMLLLMLFGAIHLFFIWSGDILLLYAIAGLLLTLFVSCSDRTLSWLAVILIFLPIGFDVLTAFFAIDFAAPFHAAWWDEAAERGISEENFATWLRDAETYPQMFAFLCQGAYERLWEFVSGHRLPKVLALFIVGYLIGKHRLFARLTDLPLSRFLRCATLPALFLSALYAFSATHGRPWGLTIHSILYAFSVIPLAFCYVAAFCLLFTKKGERQRPTSVFTLMAAPGRMALTNYILQSLIGILLFYGLGFGLGTSFGLIYILLTALAVFLLQIFFSRLWLSHFLFGPLEWFWRICTYGRYFKILKLVPFFLPLSAYPADWLFRNGKSNYSIVLHPEASASEQTAARELQHYIHQVSGVHLPITSDLHTTTPSIIIGFNERVSALTNSRQPEANDESFTYRTVGHDLLIWGGAQRGTMYGVFTFLERELGIHWFTPKCTVIPQLKRYKLPRLNHTEHPFIAYRYSNYYVAGGAPEWSAHTRENTKWDPVTNDYGNIEAYYGAHTMDWLVPANEFFATHPEYFCLRDGQRYNGYGQLCLSNPDVLQLCKTRLKQRIRENPAYRIYSLSQNDNFRFCECEKCAAIEQQYGGHSGIILWFVNQVADAVKEEFPDKFVGTFAYQYSRQPPTGIKPRDNVVIRLCSIECCFAHPLDAGCPQNQAFMRDLRGWAQLAPHLFIWDYIVDYAQYIAPWPNFQVLAPNIRVFGKNKAIGVFEEAQYQSAGAEFDEMKAWTVNQLLWNPYQDVDSLVNIFCQGFYREAAPHIMDYYRLCQSLVKPDVHFGIYIRENHEIYSDAFIQKAFDILRKARQSSNSDEIRQRVDRVRMQPLYLQCMRHKSQSLNDGTWQELLRLMKLYKAMHREGYPQERFIREFEQ